MLRRILSATLLGGALASLSACAGGQTASLLSPETASTPTTSPIPTALASLGGFTASGDLAHSALGLYTLLIDPVSLSATATLNAVRTVEANDDLYLLSIDSFLRPGSFRVTGVSSTASTLDIAWQLAHPFPAPSNPLAPPNGFSNRSDLGIAGQVVLLADVPSATGNTYFTDVIANTELVVGAHGYLQPRGLLTLSTTANAFPYLQLVDESGLDGSRLGVSNGGIPTGNFGTDGWTRAEYGAGNAGWTGYGVLHQGQTTQGTLSLSLPAIQAAGTLSLDVAILAKYNDPRGGGNATEKKANRLPGATPDATRFAYRMPHGALDVAQVDFLGESGGFLTNALSASELRFRVTDFDARAIETTEADLANESDVTRVAQGESGLPLLSVAIPGVLGDATATATLDPGDVLDDDTAYGGDVDQDSGQPGDGIVWASSVTKLVTSGQTDGFYTGLVRATDPEASLTPALTLGLDASTLLPMTANLPVPETFQAFEVTLTTPNIAPNVTLTGPGATVLSGNGQLTLSVTAFNDGDGDPVSIQFDWNDDGDFDDAGEGWQVLSGTPPLAFNAPVFYSNATLTPDTRTVPYQFTDGIILTPITDTIDWTLSANRAPVVTSGTITLQASSLAEPATFALVNSALTVTDPEGDAVTYTVRAVPTSGSTEMASGLAEASLNGFNASPVMGPWMIANSTIAVTIYANDALHATTAGTVVPSSPLTGTVTVAGCGLDMSAVSSTLATLTTGNALRTGTGANQPLTGIRVGWSDISGEAQYLIQRATWAPGATIASVTFTDLGTAAANATSYDDTTINAAGTRYLYRVLPRCTVGGPTGTASQLAMVALQNFESAAVGNALQQGYNDWFVDAPSTASATVLIDDNSFTWGAGTQQPVLNGNRDLLAYEFGTSPSPYWVVVGPPALNDRANFAGIGTSIFEFAHCWGAGGSNTSGYTLLSNTSRPSGTGTSPTPNNWRWLSTFVDSTRGYTDTANSTMIGTVFPNISGQVSGSYNFGTAVSGAPLFTNAQSFTESFSRVDASAATFGAFNHDHVFIGIMSSSNGNPEGARFDDCAWIVY